MVHMCAITENGQLVAEVGIAATSEDEAMAAMLALLTPDWPEARTVLLLACPVPRNWQELLAN